MLQFLVKWYSLIQTTETWNSLKHAKLTQFLSPVQKSTGSLRLTNSISEHCACTGECRYVTAAGTYIFNVLHSINCRNNNSVQYELLHHHEITWGIPIQTLVTVPTTLCIYICVCVCVFCVWVVVWCEPHRHITHHTPHITQDTTVY